MSYRFTSTIDLGNGDDLSFKAGDSFRFDPNRPDCLFKNNTHYIKVGLMKKPDQLVASANKLSNYLMGRAIAFYRGGYKFSKSYKNWQRRERLHPDIAETIWNHYNRNGNNE